MKIDVELCREVKERILAEPDMFDMGTYASESDDGCGTVCCLAGHAAVARGWKVNHRSWFATKNGVEIHIAEAAELEFAVKKTEGDDEYDALSDKLFFLSGWPSEFRKACNEDGITPQREAQVTAELLQSIIDRGGEIYW